MGDEFNFIILNGNQLESDKQLFFGDEEVEFLNQDCDIFDILVKIGLFESKSKARKNWKKCEVIPKGFSDFIKLGKFNKRLTILNPIEEEKCHE